MDPQIKAQWLKDLRSGEFPQGTNYMVIPTSITGMPTKYCCWGVLEAQRVGRENVTGFAYPLQETLDWAGIQLTDGPTVDIVRYLAGLNDQGNGFGWIIEEIDEYL